MWQCEDIVVDVTDILLSLDNYSVMVVGSEIRSWHMFTLCNNLVFSLVANDSDHVQI